MRIECYGATVPEDGRQHSQNQDGFLIVREPVVTAAVCDGAGNAQHAARRVLSLLDRLLKEATLGQMLSADLWPGWVRVLDSALLDGPESTLVATMIIGAEARCVAVGDSRIYLLPSGGGCELLNDGAGKARLGSGECVPFTINRHLAPRDVLVLVSDGAWAPLGSARLERLVRSGALEHFSDVPQAVLDAAGQHGHGDDMTTVALRLIPVS